MTFEDQEGGLPAGGQVGLERPAHTDAILERLLALHPKSIDLSLGRLERLLKALGNPEKSLPPVIHIAGTNGKGSTTAYLRAGLSSAGFGVSAYTSPHLVRFHERVRLPKGLIEEAELAELLEECERVNADEPITFFEITTAAALLAFSRSPADWLLLEVGLGGRLDATNVVKRPAATVITPVSLDHQQFLGESLAEIAREKAGVLKRGVPCIVGPQTDEALDVIRAEAERIGAPLLIHGQDWMARREHGRLVFEDAQGLSDLPLPKLNGAHQIENAGAAVATLRTLGLEPGALDVAEAGAVENVEWLARMQRLKRGPLVALADEEMELWLDGGHNPAAGIVASSFMAELEEQAPQPLYLVCGMLKTKDPAGYLRAFNGLARRVIAVSIPGEQNSFPAEVTAAAAASVGLPTASAGSVESALKMIRAEIENDLADPTPRVLICGSLYLAGSVLRENG